MTVESSFSGAHQLIKSNSPCENLHGHNWRVALTVRSEKQESEVGWVIDFKVLKDALNKELEKFDHKYLNDVLPVSPTAENLAKQIYRDLAADLPVYKVTVWETEKASAAYYEQEHK
ncbi:6-carboxytetrahydropterin synthase QueD [Candidatus Termititenax spirochaetophilus]|uniref:6-carboxy-5,6,7,8-tetrahydropterin synthase n=1 Tax=Candidatus Termititenax spirochaetophilus TaxID=2218522 RepID=A0A388T8E8_9BACT|nr:6-carboxytetrahydropterin synthase QueD [Candidatus Termititenax spirochaetophilus]